MSWSKKQRLSAIRLIVIEGLGGSGKSTLLGNVSEFFETIDLDRFLPNPADRKIPWLQQVLDGGAQVAIENGLTETDCLIVGGVVVSPIISKISLSLLCNQIRHVYVKKLGTLAGQPYWHDGDDLNATGMPPRPPYMASADDYHRKCRPWETADLVIERLAGD